MDLTAKRVMMGKTLNAGQICLAPDYVMVPKDKARRVRRRGRQARSATMFPTLKDNPDYTSVINQRHYRPADRLYRRRQGQGRGDRRDQSGEGGFPPAALPQDSADLVLNPTDDMKIMKDEIFGPLLPVKTYDNVDEAIGYVNDHPRPLGLYYFGTGRRRSRKRC